ncbi:HipA domain-containing protein [Mycolicibacterium conceptionense]|uniref:HipA domain-containing protein n=1 Tax=Mycolicibacterium conceptionense TaxID=451644 RepID=UPI0032047B67
MPQTQFEVWDVSDWEVFSDETEGAEEKWWIINPADQQHWLFKPPVDKFGFQQGEDWAERVSTELARAIGVPCADVELGHREHRRGSMSRRLQPRGWEIQPGQLLLTEFDPGYVSKAKGRPGHSLTRIAHALTSAQVEPPAGGPAGLDAFDVFAGYMLLDAWIANRDRHDDNWAILIPPPGEDSKYRLCGSYDQSSSLGYNVNPKMAARILNEPDGVSRWAHKGTAHRFESGPDGPITLVDHAVRALQMCRPVVRALWIDNLRTVTQDMMDDLLDSVPDLSDLCRTFASEVLRINHERLLDACQHL